MTLDRTLAETGVSGTVNQESREQFSVAWWQNRTAEELRDIIKRGFAGGDAFQGAVVETERRARDETQRLRQLAAVEAAKRKKRIRMMAVGGVAALIALVFAGWWFPL